MAAYNHFARSVFNACYGISQQLSLMSERLTLFTYIIVNDIHVMEVGQLLVIYSYILAIANIIIDVMGVCNRICMTIISCIT